MVRCILQGKFDETCLEEETTSDVLMEEYGLEGGLKCMMNGVIYYPGVENVTEFEFRRELRAALHATKIFSSHFDHLGRPRLKIVYVDYGDVSGVNTHIEDQINDHIDAIIRAEKEREERDDIPLPRLIFVKQDRDYWPGSEKDPDVMARRAAKALKAHQYEPDYYEIVVPPLPEEEKPWPKFFADDKAKKAFFSEVGRLDFLRYFDPSMPGTEFILDHMPEQRASVLSKYKKDPDLWKEWIRATTPAPTPSPAPAINEGCEEMLVCASQLDGSSSVNEGRV